MVDVILDRETSRVGTKGDAIDSLNRHSMTRLRELLRFPLPGNFTVADSIRTRFPLVDDDLPILDLYLSFEIFDLRDFESYRR